LTTKKSTNGYVVSNSVDEEIVSNAKGEFVIQGLDQGTTPHLICIAHNTIPRRLSFRIRLFVIQGLDQGTYYLKEIKAPDGYTLLKEAIEIQITPTFVAIHKSRNPERIESYSSLFFLHTYTIIPAPVSTQTIVPIDPVTGNLEFVFG